jgi:hypothetical protein
MGYAVGVVLGACMYFFTAQGTEKWGYYWQCRALRPQDPQTEADKKLAANLDAEKRKAEEDGRRLNDRGNACFWGRHDLFCFVEFVGSEDFPIG